MIPVGQFRSRQNSHQNNLETQGKTCLCCVFVWFDPPGENLMGTILQFCGPRLDKNGTAKMADFGFLVLVGETQGVQPRKCRQHHTKDWLVCPAAWV